MVRMSGTRLSGRADAAAALMLMQEALERLDRSEFALDAAAHLDLAICRLRDDLGPKAFEEGPLEASCRRQA